MLLAGSIGWGLIAIGAITHVWHHERLRDLVGRHLDADRSAALALVVAEVTITAAVALGVLLDGSWLPLAAIGGGLLAIGFVIWIARLLATGSELPCACSFSAAPTSVWSLARAMAVLSISLLWATDPASATVGDRVVALAVGLALAGAIYVLPESLGWPDYARAQLARLDSHAPTQARR